MTFIQMGLYRAKTGVYKRIRGDRLLIVMSCPHCVDYVALVSVFWGSGVVSGNRGKQMTP